MVVGEKYVEFPVRKNVMTHHFFENKAFFSYTTSDAKRANVPEVRNYEIVCLFVYLLAHQSNVDALVVIENH